MNSKNIQWNYAGNLPDLHAIKRYCTNTAKPEEIRQIELAMASDSLFAEAMEGYMQINDWNEVLSQHEVINNRLQYSYLGKIKSKSVVKFSVKWLAIAASMALLFGITFLLQDRLKNTFQKQETANNNTSATQNPLANNRNKDTTITLGAMDSFDANSIASATTTTNIQENIAASNDGVLTDNSRNEDIAKLEAPTEVPSVKSLDVSESNLASEADIAPNKEAKLQAEEWSEKGTPKQPKVEELNENPAHIPAAGIPASITSTGSAAPASIESLKKDEYTLDNLSAVEVVSKSKKNDKYTIKTSTNQTLQVGIQYYDQGQFGYAEQVFDDVLQSDKNNATALGYKCKSLAKQGKAEASYSALKKLNKQNVQYAEAQWLTAQSLHKNKNKNAQELLKKIAESNSPYKEEAKKLLSQ